MNKLGVAYGAKKKNMMAKGGTMAQCPDCMAAGGRCMSHGGQVSQEEGMMHPKKVYATEDDVRRYAKGGQIPASYPLNGAPSIPRSKRDEAAMKDDMHRVQSSDAKLGPSTDGLPMPMPRFSTEDSRRTVRTNGDVQTNEAKNGPRSDGYPDSDPRVNPSVDQDRRPGDVQTDDAKYARGGMIDYLEDAEDRGMQDTDDDIDRTDNQDHFPGNDQSDMDTFAEGGEVLDSIMKDRKSSNAETAYGRRMDLEPVHTESDPEHDMNSPSIDDASLIGQILMDRKRRRGE